MDKYLSRNDLLETIQDSLINGLLDSDTARKFRRCILDTKEAQVVEERVGEWVRDTSYTGKNKEIYYCSSCNHYQSNRRNREPSISAFHMRFCPSCGARMLNAICTKTSERST